MEAGAGKLWKYAGAPIWEQGDWLKIKWEIGRFRPPPTSRASSRGQIFLVAFFLIWPKIHVGQKWSF
jgi:hypothetical protein